MENPRDPDDKLLFDLLRKVGMDGGEAYIAVQVIRAVAGQNIIAAMEARSAKLETQMEAHSARMEARIAELKAQSAAQVADLKAEIRNIYRFIGYVGVALGLFATAIMFAYQAGRGG